MRKQMLIVAAVLGSAAGLAGQTQEIQDKIDDVLKLQGTWVYQGATRQGKAVDFVMKSDLVFEKNKVTFVDRREGKETKRSTDFDIDVKKTPRVLNIRTQGERFDPKTKEVTKIQGVMKASYEINGDTLRIAPAGPNQEAPASFKDDNAVIVTYKRAK